MKTKVFSCALACLLIFCAANTFAIDKTIYYRNAKTLGMGNAKVAGGFGYNGFVDNPALLARVKPFRFSLLNLPITTNENFWDVTSFIADNSDKFQTYGELPETDKSEFLNDIEEFDASWSRIKLTPMVDIAASFFSQTELSEVKDSKGNNFKGDSESIKKAIDENGVIFTVFNDDTIAFGKDEENPGMYFISRTDTEARKVFDNFDDAYKYWLKHYRKQYNEGLSVGLALFNNSTIALKIDRGVYEPRVWGEGISDMAAVLGVAKPLNMLCPGLTVGVNLKFLQRRTADIFQIKASQLGEAADTIEPVLEEAEESKTSTIAADIGMLWDVGLIDSEVAATFQSIGDGRGSSFDIGIAKHFFDDNLSVFADIIDFFDNNSENFFRKLHIGSQLKMGVLYLRAGLNSGYPTLGTGLNLRVFDIDFAYFTEELSNAPGVDDDTRYALQFKLGW